MTTNVGALLEQNVSYVSCTCVSCNENCGRNFIDIDEFEKLDGVYCPAFDCYTEWVVDTAFDGNGEEIELKEVAQ